MALENSLVDLLANLLLDCERWSSAPVHRDVRTLRERVKHEGDGFITITLPAFCRDFERSLAEGRVAPGSFLSFGKIRSGIPSFLKGFLRRVFDERGVLLDNPSIDCIRSVRQICLFGKKVERPCSDARLSLAMERFAQCDNEIRTLPDSQVLRYFKLVSDIIVKDTLKDDEVLADLIPKHGPGQTRESITGNGKWIFRRWHRRLTSAGFTWQRFANGTSHGSLPCKYHERDHAPPELVEPWDEEPTRVVFVPKTLKTPRVIAVEPVCMQYAQQALMRWMVGRLDTRPLTAGHLNFKDQSVNQHFAKEGSSEGIYATLDLSEASDRVSLELVEIMLRGCPKFLELALASRSTRAQLPTGEVILLKKFASMGSALCFPVEALVFYTIIIASRIARAGRFPTRRSVREFSRSVYVFGDDLIVPTDEAEAIAEDLKLFGLKVNEHKSFWTGKFRESCGTDCYNGEDVTPTYLRRDIPSDRTDPSGLVSCVATANQLCQAGYRRASMLLRKSIERVLGPLPLVPTSFGRFTPGSAAIGWFSDSEREPRKRWNEDLQRCEHLCWTTSVSYAPDPLVGQNALVKCLLSAGSREPVDEAHLERSVRPYGLALKRRWVPLSTY